MARRRNRSNDTTEEVVEETAEVVEEEEVVISAEPEPEPEPEVEEDATEERPIPLVYTPAGLLHPDAPNFRMYEVARSQTAARHNIDNTPPADIIAAAQALAVNVLQPIRNEFGSFSPQSWYRSEALERQLCQKSFMSWRDRNPGKTWQDYFARKSHPKGEAVDFEIIGISNDELFQWCKENLEFDQLIREFPKAGDPTSGWVHISYSATNNRNEAFTIG